MNFNEYQEAAYFAIQSHDSKKEEEAHWAMGLSGESGEVTEVIKHRHFGGGFSVTDLVEELGDVVWNIAALCTVFGIKMDDVMSFNLAKLKHRYPHGTFSADRSSKRSELSKAFRATDEAKAIMSVINEDYIASQKKGRIK